jgi:hypothetical protein
MTNVPDDLQERIAAYIDGELSPAEAARLEVFLANTDPELAKQVIQMIANKGMLRLAPKPMAPRDLSARVMEQIERASLLHNVEHLSTPKSAAWKSKGLIAAGLLLVLGGFSYFMWTTAMTPSSDYWRTVATHTPGRDAAVPPSAPASETKTEAYAKDADRTPAAKGGLDGMQLADAGESMRERADMSKAAAPAARMMEKGSEASSAASTPATPAPAAAPVQTPAINRPTAQARADDEQLRPAETEESRRIAMGGVGGGGGMAGGAVGGGERTLGGGLAGGFGGGAGRGGGGRGGALGPSASAAPGRDKADNATAAVVASVLRDQSDTPVVLAFVPRDTADISRLQDAIQTYAVANGREGARLAETFANRAGGNYYNVDNNYRQNAAPRPAGSLPGDQASALNNSTSLNNSNGFLGNKQGSPNQANGWNFGANMQNANQDADVVYAQRAAQVVADAPVAEQQLAAGVVASPAPVRVLLKPEQIETLASQFRVAMVARGNARHEFPRLADEPAVRTADRRYVDDLLQRARRAEAGNNLGAGRTGNELSSRQQELAGTQSQSGGANRALDAQVTGNSQNIATPQAGPGTPVGGTAQGNLALGTTGEWVECIVTIEPPATSAPTTLPGR